MINPDLRGYSYNEPFPFLIIENVFSDDQLEIIWKELEYYCSDYDNFFLSPESTGGAMDGPKYIKKNADCFYRKHGQDLIVRQSIDLSVLFSWRILNLTG